MKEGKLIPMNLQLHAAPTMNPIDAVAGDKATCYVTINGERYLLVQLIEFTSELEIPLKEVPRVGATIEAKRPAGPMKASFSAKVYQNTDLFLELAMEYKKTGIFPPIDIQTTNEDPMSRAGRHTLIHKDCYIEKLPLAQILTGEEWLEAEVSGVINDFDLAEKFKEIEGMR